MKTFSLILFSIFILLMGCKDDSISTEVDNNNSYLGIWELVGYIDEGEEYDNEGDVYYINITENKITEYDYMGDSFDEGPDCYEVYETTIIFDNDVIIIDLEEFGTYSLRLDIENDQLRVFEDEEESYISLWKRSDKEVSSFVPECTSKRVNKASKFWHKK